MVQTVLILGQNGKFGRNAAKAFKDAGWQVRGFRRGQDTLRTAVQGVEVVVNGWNPPDYSTWAGDLLPMHRSVISALKGSDTTVIVPGNVYVFGAGSPSPWGVQTPHNATNPLGKLRIKMEQDYRASGVRTILLRGGDFLDTEASGNWFDKIMVAKLGKGHFTWPGDLKTPHAWAFLPDMARAAVGLAEKRAELPEYCDVPFTGFTLTGGEMGAYLAEARGQEVTVKQMSWWPLKMLRPVWPALRGLCEMAYLWRTPHSLDPSELERLLPEFEATSPQKALEIAARHIPVRKRGGHTVVSRSLSGA